MTILYGSVSIIIEAYYRLLLQMHGEKVEEVEELRLDLLDVKEMYKVQVNYQLVLIYWVVFLHN